MSHTSQPRGHNPHPGRTRWRGVALLAHFHPHTPSYRPLSPTQGAPNGELSCPSAINPGTRIWGNRTCWSGSRPRIPSQGPSPKGSSHVRSLVLSWGRAANPIANPPTPRGDPITNSVGHPGSQHPGVRARASPTAPPLPKKPVPQGWGVASWGRRYPRCKPPLPRGDPRLTTTPETTA